MTREEYVAQKLGAEIGRLHAEIANLEFLIQFLNDENTKLKTEIESLKSRDNEREEVKQNEDE